MVQNNQDITHKENVLSSFLRSALSDQTRKYRSRLLVVCVVGFLFTKLDLRPSEFAPFGIKFTEKDIHKLPPALFALNLYFFVMYILYCITDVLSYFINIWHVYSWDKHQYRAGNQPPQRQYVFPKPTRWLGFTTPKYLDVVGLFTGLIRFLVDVIMPFFLSIYILIELWHKIS